MTKCNGLMVDTSGLFHQQKQAQIDVITATPHRQLSPIGRTFKIHFSLTLDLPRVKAWAKARDRRIHSSRFEDLKVDVFIF